MTRRVLFLSQILPYPLDAGAKVRAHYMLRHLAERHRVTLVSFVRPTDAAGNVGRLAEICEAVHPVCIKRSLARDFGSLIVAAATGQPALIVRDRSARYEALVGRLLHEQPFDAVHVDQIKTAQHVERFAARPPRLIDKHNVYCEMIGQMALLTSSGVRRRLLEREARVMARYEAQTCRRFDEILAVTAHDAERLREMTGDARPVTAIPICVDPGEQPIAPPTGARRNLVMLGGMFYPPNVDGAVWFLREILPRIQRQAVGANVAIIGARPAPAIRRAAAPHEHVTVAGYVEDAGPHLAAAAALLVPVRAGGGMRVKILEAMARGAPVVATRLGARGIDAENGRDILLADTPEAFAQAALRLLREPALGVRLAENARRLIEERYDWRARYREVDAVYERLFASGDRP